MLAKQEMYQKEVDALTANLSQQNKLYSGDLYRAGIGLTESQDALKMSDALLLSADSERLNLKLLEISQEGKKQALDVLLTNQDRELLNMELEEVQATEEATVED